MVLLFRFNHINRLGRFSRKPATHFGAEWDQPHSGWVCNASHVYVVIDDNKTYTMAYGTKRTDTLSVCGDTDNGFGFLFNYNSLGDGQHTIQALADGVEFGRATFTVTTLGQDYLEGATRTFESPDFPNPGTTLTLTWQEHLQNFTDRGERIPALL